MVRGVVSPLPDFASAVMYPKLSKREGEAFAAIAFGEANPDIAAALQIIETTVRAHVEYTRSKLGVAAGRRHRLFEDA